MKAILDKVTEMLLLIAVGVLFGLILASGYVA